MPGPLTGLRIIEMGGIGPGQFAGMMLADHGADVIRIDRPGAAPARSEPMLRSRQLVSLDLKDAADVARLRRLIGTADALVDVFRPGVMERLGLGPDVLLAHNPRLVYARMTGWGQSGPYAPRAGHDLNYISLAGAAHAVGPPERPLPPLALVGDYGGGGMLLAFSVLAACRHAQRTGTGQVVDCAMSEGAGLLMTQIYGMYASGQWQDRRGVNILDGGAPFYCTYATADGKFISIAAIEPQFYARLLHALGLSGDPEFAAQLDTDKWPSQKDRLARLFSTRTRDEWCSLLEHEEACFAPVLSLGEAPGHPHALARASFVRLGEVLQPAPAPRYSASALDAPRLPGPADIDELYGGSAAEESV